MKHQRDQLVDGVRVSVTNLCQEDSYVTRVSGLQKRYSLSAKNTRNLSRADEAKMVTGYRAKETNRQFTRFVPSHECQNGLCSLSRL